MMRQACVLEALHHPGIPRVFECGLLDGRPWVAFERIEGVSLETDMRSRRLSAAEVVNMIDHVAAILADAHARGVLHRDIQPSVIYRCQNRGYPYVLDGWVSACTLDTELANPLEGSHRYRASELVGEGPADGRADVYALGAIAYEALTGESHTARHGDDIAGAPKALAWLLAAMTLDDKDLRPDAADVRRALVEIRHECMPEGESLDIALDSLEAEAEADGECEIECIYDDDALQRGDLIAARSVAGEIIEPPPRNKPRWTPPWGLDDRSLAPCIVEIMPRGRRDPRRDD